MLNQTGIVADAIIELNLREVDNIIVELNQHTFLANAIINVNRWKGANAIIELNWQLDNVRYNVIVDSDTITHVTIYS